MKSRLLVVDDQVLFAQSLTEVILSKAEDIEVVGIGYNGREAVELTRELSPDLVLLDVRMPEMSGVAAVPIIHEMAPQTSIVMLTTYDDDEYVTTAINAGAIGYLLKDMPADDLIAALQAIRSGGFFLPAGIAQKIVRPLTGTVYHGGFEGSSLPAWYYELSPRDRRILRYLAERLTNREIAQRVNLAEQTVKNYLSSIYDVIGVSSRQAAARVAAKIVHFL